MHVKYTMNNQSGIEKETREELSEILRRSKATISVREAASILKKPALEVAQLLARLAKQGWLVRIRRGLYMPVPLESKTPANVIGDPQVIAMRVFEPCYIGGWSAAEYWGLTEQIFKTIVVITTKSIRERKVKIQTSEFWIKRIAKSRFFGTKVIWKEQVRVLVSDPAKTIVDMLDDPVLCGGARMFEKILNAYLSSKDKNLNTLIDYAGRMNNGAIYKRLGFFLERFQVKDDSVIAALRKKLTTGNVKLDPALPAEQLVTRWRLWAPAHWKEPKND